MRSCLLLEGGMIRGTWCGVRGVKTVIGNCGCRLQADWQFLGHSNDQRSLDGTVLTEEVVQNPYSTVVL
jgi:hypothetical protein